MADENLTVEQLKSWRKKKLASSGINEENKMGKLQEILEITPKILSEKKTADGDTMDVLVNWAQSGAKTGNGRIYSEKILTREINKLQEKVKKNSLIGNADHPESGFSNLKNASHVITGLDLDENGKAWANLRILPTDAGKNIQTLIRNKATIGVSSRGAGSVDEKTGEVQDDYTLLGIDIVANPSFSGGTLSLDNISESLDLEEKEALSEETIKFIQSKAYEQSEEIGFSGTYEEFLKEYGTAIEATILVEDGVYPNIETALVSMGHEDVLKKMRSEEKIKVWTEKDIWLEAISAGISPKDFCRKLNENEKRKQIDRDSGISEEKVRSLMAEAEKAGIMNLSDPKKREEHLKKMSEIPVYSENTIHERAVDIQKRMLKEGKEASDIEVIKEVIVFEDEKENIQKRRNAIKSQCDREMHESNAFMSNEETRKFINYQLKAAGLEILNEEGE